MWTCEKCGREFANINQNHSCGKKPDNVDDYINSQPTEIQPILRKVREVICSAAPNAIEKFYCKCLHFGRMKI